MADLSSPLSTQGSWGFPQPPPLPQDLPPPPPIPDSPRSKHQRRKNAAASQRDRSSTIDGDTPTRKKLKRPPSFHSARNLPAASQVASTEADDTSFAQSSRRPSFLQKMKSFIWPNKVQQVDLVEAPDSERPPNTSSGSTLKRFRPFFGRLSTSGTDSGRRRGQQDSLQPSAVEPRLSDVSFVTAPDHLSVHSHGSALTKRKPAAPDDADYAALNALRLKSLEALKPAATSLETAKPAAAIDAVVTRKLEEKTPAEEPLICEPRLACDDPEIAALHQESVEFLTALKKGTSEYESILYSLKMFIHKSEDAVMTRFAHQWRNEVLGIDAPEPEPAPSGFIRRTLSVIRPRGHDPVFSGLNLLHDVAYVDSEASDDETPRVVCDLEALRQQILIQQPLPPTPGSDLGEFPCSGGLSLPGPELSDLDEFLALDAAVQNAADGHADAAESSTSLLNLTPASRRMLRADSEERQRNRKSTVIEARCYTALSRQHGPLPRSDNTAGTQVESTVTQSESSSSDQLASRSGTQTGAETASIGGQRAVPGRAGASRYRSSSTTRSDCSVMFV